MLVVIPCWRRPAHLYALLQTIARARDADKQTYLVTVDRGWSDDIVHVLDGFPLKRRVLSVTWQGYHPYHGPAFNILSGWRKAAALLGPGHADEPIGLLEEDLLVSEDIFEFWEDALALDPWVAGVSACRNQNWPLGLSPHAPGSKAANVYKHTSYQSLAVAMRKHVVDEVLAHATPAYFNDPNAYCHTHLPDDGLPRSACSQDGLFHRVIRRANHHLLYPVVPRACHIGWYGYNRHGVELGAAWKSDGAHLLTMSADQMNELADPRFRDIERCDLIRPRANLALI